MWLLLKRDENTILIEQGQVLWMHPQELFGSPGMAVASDVRHDSQLRARFNSQV